MQPYNDDCIEVEVICTSIELNFVIMYKQKLKYPRKNLRIHVE